MAKGASAVLVMAVVLMFATNATASLTDGLISYWNFDSGSGTTATDSAGSNNGTIYGATPTAGGVIGGALSFDGVNDYVDVGDKANLDFGATNSFTIAAWIKGTKANSPIVNKRVCDGGYHYAGYNFVVHQNKLNFGVEDINGNRGEIFGNTVITDGEWHLVVAIRNTVTHRLYLYLDGVQDASPAIDFTPTTLATGEPFHIGHRVVTISPGNHYFGGLMDDVRVYSRALSASEITELYLIPEPGTILLLGLGGLFLRKRK